MKIENPIQMVTLGECKIGDVVYIPNDLIEYAMVVSFEGIADENDSTLIVDLDCGEIVRYSNNIPCIPVSGVVTLQ